MKINIIRFFLDSLTVKSLGKVAKKNGFGEGRKAFRMTGHQESFRNNVRVYHCGIQVAVYMELFGKHLLITDNSLGWRKF